MGLDVYTYLNIGVAVPHNKLFKEKTVQITPNKCCPNVGKFCSECGSKLQKTEEFCIDPNAEDTYWEKFFGFDIVKGCHSHDTDDWIICGLKIEGNNNIAFLSPGFNLEKIKKDMCDKLSPFGLWDESKFGLYSISYMSY